MRHTLLLCLLTCPCVFAQTPNTQVLATDLPADFIPEGVAFDAARQRWLLGSVHLRRIDAVDMTTGKAQRFASGLDSVLGLHLAPDAQTLWAAATALPNGDVTVKSARTGLWVFDLASGRRRARHLLPTKDAKANLGDFVFLDARTIIASDSGTGAVWRFDTRTRRYTTVLPAGSFESPQGLAPGRTAGHFYLADYASGLWSIAPDGKRSELTAPAGVELRGIDGLYRDGDRLLAIQNGTRTHRVVLICLDAHDERIRFAKTLAEAGPGWDEPTLGELVGDRFVFVANSQWNKFDEQHRLAPLHELVAPHIGSLGVPDDACPASQ